ncbi:hypothetical protein KI809_07835 [Geobacter pelophilus]|uniref:Uncharacterized protein n=1 Tax=Geoanaerobacter pelophilus TaxID=60036 RepID=A0AAW4LAJ4_9BACT|nr:hypothetical protein [Geoanaerobacter pelophilus]MBT0664211.1 hypothetical protein [Geoanaerobacter pelophilus]
MAITIKNKQTGEIIKHGKPVVTSMTIDFLTMTVNVPEKEKSDVLNAFIAYCENWGIKHHATGLYRNQAKINSNKGQIILSIDPWIEDHNFIRAEFNPSKVSIYEVATALNLLLKNGFEKLIHEGRITRIDLAFLVKYLHVSNLFVYYPKFQYSKNTLKSGKIQTAYLGDDSGPKILAIYDKNAEIQNCNNKPNMPKENIPPYPLTRVELRLRKQKNLKFTDLKNLENPFSSMSMVTSPKTKDDPLRLAFLRLCRYEGFNAALNIFKDKKKRQDFRDSFFSEGDSSWWNPDELWKTLPAALDKIYPFSVKGLHLISKV